MPRRTSGGKLPIDAPVPFPTRGTPGGWCDPWDDPSTATAAMLRAAAAWREQEQAAVDRARRAFGSEQE